MLVKAIFQSIGLALRRFRDRQAGLTTSTVIAVLVGAVSPLLMPPLTFLLSPLWYSTAWVPVVALSLLLATLVAAVHWRTASGQFRWNITVARQSFLAAVLLAVALACSTFCFDAHVCMVGHMDHPPYTIREYAGDALWVASLILSLIFLARIRSHASLASALLTGFLLSYRFVFGSFGGILGIPL